MEHYERRGLDPGACSIRGIVILIIALISIGAGAWLLSRAPSTEQMARSQLAIERAETLQPWNMALGVTWRIVAIGVGLVLLLGLVAAIRAGARWLNLRSRLIHADRETGQFPAVEVSPGAAVVDLNRLPDGKVMTGVLGGKTALLLTLFFRHLLGKEVPEIDERPSVIIQRHDTSPEQLQVTTQAQAAQALAAASRGMTSTQATQAAQGLLMRPVQRDLPPLLVEENAPHDVQLLLEEGKRQWDQRQSDAAAKDEDLQGG